MAKNARLSSESRWRQLTEALIELGRTVKILEARIEALENPPSEYEVERARLRQRHG